MMQKSDSPQRSETRVGGNLSRVDAEEIVTGQATYTTDINMPGMLHAKVLRSPHGHARILSIDASRAMKLEGVMAVVTAKDLPRVIYNSADKSPSVPHEFPFDQYLLDDEVRYVGDQVAFVAATDEQTAENALELIDVKYEVLPAVYDPEEAVKEGAPKVNTYYSKENVAATINAEFGDVEKGFKEADYVFEGRYTTPRQAQYPLEPYVSVASYKGGKLTIWSSLQTPFCVREQVAKVLQLPMGSVRIITPYVGGAFGAKQETVTEPIAAILSIKTGRPVKLQFTAEEMFTAGRPRHPTVTYLKTGVKKDGTFVARTGRSYVDTGAYLSHGKAVTGALAWCFQLLYRCENVKFASHTVYTNTVPAGAYRGFGNPQITFAVESQVDEIARELGVDPLEIRLKNILHKGDMDRMNKSVLRSYGVEDCLREASAKADWKSKRREYGSQQGRVRRGIGMAAFGWGTGAKPALTEAATAIVKMSEDGSVNILTGIADMGMGTKTTFAIIASEVLGIEPKAVKFVDETIDTAAVVFDKGTHASRSTYVGGNAVMLACRKVRQKLIEQASRMLEVDASQLDAGSGDVFVKGQPSRRVSYSKIVADAQFGREPHLVDGEATFDQEANAVTSGVQIAEVEADMETGAFRVLRVVTANDVGKIINPRSAREQIEGAFIQGYGYALMENLRTDKATGRLANPNLREYKLPLLTDIPELEIINVETMDPTGPFGAKGIAELGLIPTGAAVRNAIFHATGVKLNSLPVTRESLREALRA